MRLIFMGTPAFSVPVLEALVAAVREAIGYEIDLCIDCHGKYNVRERLYESIFDTPKTKTSRSTGRARRTRRPLTDTKP